VLRSDRGLENLGRMADLADTPALVAVGDSGALGGRQFVVLGRVQLKHDLGGVWDEWYLGYGGGKWGWLAYAQGNFYVTEALQPPPAVPRMNELQLESPVVLAGAVFRVVERKAAELASAEGELPFAPHPGQVRRYADLLGPGNGFATLDWGEGQEVPEVFVGLQVSESQLSVTQRSERPRKDIGLSGLNCPSCGAPLKITAGNRVERIACQYCAAISESASQQVIARQSAARAALAIPLGSTGLLAGAQYTVIGYVLRSTDIDDETFTWTEYLLFSPGVGFRWLVNDEGIWRFVTPMNVADADLRDFPHAVRFEGKYFRQRNANVARVEYVLGEFYWKVSVGETVQVTDLEHGTELISREAMDNEVAWSHSRAIPWAVIARAFQLPDAPADTPWRASDNAQGDSSTINAVVGFVVMLVLLVLVGGVFFRFVAGGGGTAVVTAPGGIRGGGTTGGGWSGGK
jgi:hypothetical protein